MPEFIKELYVDTGFPDEIVDRSETIFWIFELYAAFAADVFALVAAANLSSASAASVAASARSRRSLAVAALLEAWAAEILAALA